MAKPSDLCPVSLRDAALQALEQTLARHEGKDPAISTGLGALDLALDGGFEAGQLILAGARTSVGKSVFGLNLARALAVAGHPVVIWSGEMGAAVLARRLLAMLTGIELSTLRRPPLGSIRGETQRKLVQAVNALGDLPVQIFDRSMDVAQLLRVVPTPEKGRAPVLLVDHVGLLPEVKGARSREQAVAAASRGLKLAAMQHGAVVIAAAQLNREVEHRVDKRPKLSDFRESGSLEQDADVCLLLHRPHNHERDANPNLLELVVAKQRDGRAGLLVSLHFDGALQRITDFRPHASHTKGGR